MLQRRVVLEIESCEELAPLIQHAAQLIERPGLDVELPRSLGKRVPSKRSEPLELSIRVC